MGIIVFQVGMKRQFREKFGAKWKLSWGEKRALTLVGSIKVGCVVCIYANSQPNGEGR